MIKRKKFIKGALLVLLAFVAVLGISVTWSSFVNANKADVSKSVKSNNSEGESCEEKDLLEDYFGHSSDFSLKNHQMTIKVKHGKFKVLSVSVVQENNETGAVSNAATSALFATDPVGREVSEDQPLVLDVKKQTTATSTATIRFVLSEPIHGCDSYDSAEVNDDGKKANTYYFDIISEINPEVNNSVENSNYNGVCAVFRTGNGYSNYAEAFSGKVEEEDIQKYNASVVGQEYYRDIIPYCFNDMVEYNFSQDLTVDMIQTAISLKKNDSLIADMNADENFMNEFNRIWNEAGDAHDYSKYVKDGSIETKRIGLTCDANKLVDENNPDDYYVNKGYYRAEETTTSPVKENYKYNYNYKIEKKNGKEEKVVAHSETESPGQCVRTCKEATMVEYGPPVASKAGLCFEYKIRVTSRVVCESKANVQPPKQPSVNTPVPHCNNTTTYRNDAGPNDDYVACIQECDGGKYSESCSNKCFKAVYGEDNLTQGMSVTNAGSTILRLRYYSSASGACGTPFPGYDGYYYWDSGSNRVLWKSTAHTDEGGTYGRWYGLVKPGVVQSTHNRTYCVYNNFEVPFQEGFRRSYHGGICKQDCKWEYNSLKEYWNPEDAQKDAAANIKIYNTAQASCEAAASCTTKTAEFDISVDYKDKDNVKHTISFPYTTSKVDKATVTSHGKNDVETPSGTEIFIPELTIEPDNQNGYAGCYEDTNARNWYQVAWSFPGSWINNKTGEISYELNKDNGWQQQKDKFCIPLDAQSVNVIWWEKTVLGSTCNMEMHEGWEVGSDGIVRNIHASTTDFGYFGWNFDFECFYALKNEAYQLDENDKIVCPPPTETNGFEDYTFRVVDLNKLFPDAKNETDKNSVKLDSETASSLNLGRQPGFNWTLGSDNQEESGNMEFNLNIKNEGYKVNPLQLIEDIQEKGNSIYSGDSYLDYLIVLDRDTLSKIREFNRKDDKSYSDYTGSIECPDGKCNDDVKFTYYHSDLLDKLGGAVEQRGTAGKNREEGR